METLTRSGAEATASRMRKTDIDMPIREDEAPGPAVVSVLPPALRALVALWDALGDADELAPATGKCVRAARAKHGRRSGRTMTRGAFHCSRLRRGLEEKNENDWLCSGNSGIRKKRDWKSTVSSKSPYSGKRFYLFSKRGR